MEREWSGNPRRLSRTDLAEIERLIFEGATFEKAAAAVGCSTRSIQRFLATTGGLKRRLRCAPRYACHSRSERSFRAVWSPATPCGRSPCAFKGRLRPSRETLHGADLAVAIEPGVPTETQSSEAADPSQRSWLSTRGCAVKWSGVSARSGLLSRSPPGSSVTILMTCPCVFPTRRSTRRSSFRPAERCGRSSRPVSGRDERSVDLTCGSSSPAPDAFEIRF